MVVQSFISIRRKRERCNASQVAAEVEAEIERLSILPNTDYLVIEVMIPP